jgi:hypothetical protein
MEYTPILRFKPVELKILEKIQPTGVFPLLEIVDQQTFKNIDTVKKRFKEIMVELPRYLIHGNNKHSGGIMRIFLSFGGNDLSSLQTEFYTKNKEKIDIPVVSSTTSEPGLVANYKELVDGLKSIKNDFSKVAVRIFVNPIDISEANIQSLKDLSSELRKDDIILLDVINFDGVESYILKNLGKIVDLIGSSEAKRIVLLNAFDSDGDWRKDPHHYAPLIAKHFGFSGIGDFATIPRMESLGGSGTMTSVIRFFSPWDLQLMNFKSNSFKRAKQDLIKSPIWEKSVDIGHFDSCPYCKEAKKNDTEWKTFWKFFRIQHHIKSMVDDVIPCMGKFKSIEDFDMMGCDKLFKKAG